MLEMLEMFKGVLNVLKYVNKGVAILLTVDERVQGVDKRC